METKLKYYQERAADLLEQDEARDRTYAELDKAAHLDWELPEALRRLTWVLKYISSSPYEALGAGTRALSGLEPRIEVEPISVLQSLEKDTDPESRRAHERANEWEKVLMWHFSLMKGRQGILQSDISRSALQYDAVMMQVVYLPEHCKSIEAMGGNANRYKAARRYSDFAFIVHNPACVHVRWSAYMPEEVLLAKVVSARDIVDFYGEERAKKVKAKLGEDDEPECYILFEYENYETRVAWCIESKYGAVISENDTENEEAITLISAEDGKHDREFLSWVCVRGGTQLDSDPKHQYFPMLLPVVRARQWIMTNVIGTLTASEAIAETGKPDWVVEGPQSNNVNIDYGQPGNRINAPPGHKVQQLTQTPLDPGNKELWDRYEATMRKSTVAEVLVTAEAGPNEAGYTYNQRINQAVASLTPWKNLTEYAIAEGLRTMLYWIHYSGKSLRGYGKEGKDKGKLYNIDSEDIDPQTLYLKAMLIPDVPTDRVQKVTAAIQMARELQVSPEKLLEELGYTDPEGEIKAYWRSRFFASYMTGNLKQIEMQASGELQQLAAQMAQQMVQQQMQQMQQQGQQQGAPPQGLEGLPPEMAGAMGGMPPNPMGGQGIEGAQGDMFNPAQGGMIPAEASPAGNTFEGQMGMTRGGAQLA